MIALAAAVICVCALLSRLAEGRWLSAPLLLSASLLGPLLVFALPVSSLTVLVLSLAAIGFSVSYYAMVLVGRKRLPAVPASLVAVPYRELASVAMTLFAAGQIAFAINLARVLSSLGLSAYVSASSKAIELTFGSSSLLNYVFFLNMPAACIAAYLVAARRTTWPCIPIMLVATLSLAFTGIKSTMIFGSCMVLLVYMLVRRPGMAWLAVAATGMAAVTAALFIAVNVAPTALAQLGADSGIVDQVLQIVRGYVFNNYINLDLELAQRDSYTFGKYTFFFVSKLLDPNLVGYYDSDELLVVDSAFNMGTFLREYFVDFGILGALLIPFILGAITGLVANAWNSKELPRHVVTLAVLLTACLFAFFGNQFVRLQFLYVIFMAYAADLLASILHEHKRNVVRNCEQGERLCAE